MKRAGKCVGKLKYRHRSAALRVAKIWYFKNGTKYALYECPTCLDFHLTSKYVNLEKYYERWDKEFLKKQLPSFFFIYYPPLLLSPYMKLWFNIDHYEKLWKSHKQGY